MAQAPQRSRCRQQTGGLPIAWWEYSRSSSSGLLAGNGAQRPPGAQRSAADPEPPKAMLQGQLEVTTRAGTGKAAKPNALGQVEDSVDSVPFVLLGLDLPPAPLYKDALERNIIPQVPAHPPASLPAGLAVCAPGCARASSGALARACGSPAPAHGGDAGLCQLRGCAGAHLRPAAQV